MLPVVLQTDIKAYMFLAYPMCVLRAYDTLLPWYNERFINIKINENFDFQYVKWPYEMSGEIDEVFECNYIYRSMLDKDFDIISILIKQINLGWYGYVFFDEYHLKCQDAYKKYHFRHDSLIYGYDLDKECFYAISIECLMGSYRKTIYSFNEVKKGFDLEIKEKSKYDDYGRELVSIISFRPKIFYNSYSFSKRTFCDRISDYLHGTDSFNDSFYTSINPCPQDKFTYGMNAYIKFIDYIKQIEEYDRIIYRNIHFLYEHKKNMKKKIECLSLPCELMEYCEERYDKIIDNFEVVRLGILKNLLQRKRKSISKNKIIQRLYDSYTIEKKVLTIFLEHIKSDSY